VARRSRKARNRLLPALLLLAVLAAAAYLALQRWETGAPPAAAPLPSGTLRVHYVDVGQGDGVVWELPDGSLVVYDCGDVPSAGREDPMVRHLRDVLQRPPGSEVHALVASHGHKDHVGGCDGVLETYRVGHVYEAWYDGPDRPASYDRFRDRVLAEGAQLHTLQPTDASSSEQVFRRWDPLVLPPGANATATFFWPEATETDWDAVAEGSLGVRLVFGATSFCFQGDVETAQENRLAAEDSARDLSCDAYLVGHHGSREASGAAWLRRMSPSLAVVSFGENPYGHPTSAALCRVQQTGATVYATHRAGTVTLESDGRGVRVVTGTPETKDYCAAGASYWT
jgi:competence protein ComEC